VARAESLPCHIFLGAHCNYFGLEEKSPPERGGANPFIDPDGYKKYAAQKEQNFRTELAEQKATAMNSPLIVATPAKQESSNLHFRGTVWVSG